MPSGLPESGQNSALRRKLTLFPATNVVVGDMIGAGVFTTSGLLLLELGDPLLMILLWLFGGMLALSGALCYGVLGAAMPRAGGEYAYLSELYHPVLGFLSGWTSFFVGFSAPLAASSLGFSEYMADVIPLLGSEDHGVAAKKAVALLVIAILGLVHLRGLEFGAKIQSYMTVGKVGLIAVFVVVGFALGQGDVSNFTDQTISDAPTASWRVIGLSLMWIMFAYSGWNAAGYIGSEIQQPRRNLPLSLFAGTGIVLVLYMGLNTLFVFAVPPGEMQGVVAIGGLAASFLFGDVAHKVVSLLIAFGLLSAVSALTIIGPRVYYAMARDGLFFKGVADVHPVRHVPSKAIVLQGIVASLMVLTGTFDQVLTFMGFCLGIFPIITVLGVFKSLNGDELPVVSMTYLCAAVLFACVSMGILILAYTERPVESSIAVLTVAAGLPFYALFAKKKRANEKDMTPAQPT